jgi:hypothetical protein
VPAGVHHHAPHHRTQRDLVSTRTTWLPLLLLAAPAAAAAVHLYVCMHSLIQSEAAVAICGFAAVCSLQNALYSQPHSCKHPEVDLRFLVYYADGSPSILHAPVVAHAPWINNAPPTNKLFLSVQVSSASGQC